MQQRALDHIKTEIKGVSPLGDVIHYRRSRLDHKKYINYKNEDDRFIGTLSQTTLTPGTRHRIEQRIRNIKAANQGSQFINNLLLH